ncbi:MAG: response regulator [Deltaproteobacteria bacterium]|nr:response regulator [Deltaproteobacteria bacterium]
MGKEPPSLQTMIDDMTSDTYDSAHAPFEFVEEGVHTALICEQDEEIRRKTCAVLERLDFNVTEAESTRDALRYMRFHLFDLVAVDESFDGGDIDSSHMLQYLGQFHISTRRNIFVLLLSNEFGTGDRMIAFNKSVNLVVNLAEIDGLENFLKRALKENEEFYSVLRESLEKFGRV